VISRELNGLQDITLGRVAELAWAMGREVDFKLVRPERVELSNVPLAQAGALTSQKLKMEKIDASRTPNFSQPLEFVM
jgi:hypothetical protein